MGRYYYDLHTHSCLSPCADDDNTPNNLLGMASLCGIDILALTDHNTAKNCPAFFDAAARYGVIPVAGMELTTSEDIHVVCLFEHLRDALDFGEYVGSRLVQIENRPDIFGTQLVLDENDNVMYQEPYLLSNATDISVEDVTELVRKYNGICYPAHIDRDSNGIIATLGTLPEELDFSCVEFHNPEKIEDYSKKYSISNKTVIVSSDAHCLTDMRDKEFYFDIDGEPTPEQIRKRLFELLR